MAGQSPSDPRANPFFAFARNLCATVAPPRRRAQNHRRTPHHAYPRHAPRPGSRRQSRPGRPPRRPALQGLVGGLAWFALLACLAGVIVGGAMWGIAASSNNPYGVMNGKKAVVMSLLGAMVVAASGALVRFFVDTGSGI